MGKENASRILVAEDNKISQVVIKDTLCKLGYEVDLAHDGQEVVDKFENGNYDLIFMDIQMPVKDGYQATEEIREKDKKGQIKIIALTANAMAEDKEKCLSCGMDDYLSKPIQPSTIKEILDKYLSP